MTAAKNDVDDYFNRLVAKIMEDRARKTSMSHMTPQQVIIAEDLDLSTAERMAVASVMKILDRS